MFKTLMLCSNYLLIAGLVLAALGHPGIAQTKRPYRVLYRFQGGSVGDGQYPFAGLTADSAGDLYGTTSAGGDTGPGIVFKIAPDGTETVLHTFRGPDGGRPAARLTLDEAGNLYGMTMEGGRGCEVGCGTVFRLAPDGTETVLHSFRNNRRDGQHPTSGVIMDAAGNLYGTTPGGGNKGCGLHGCGVVFKIAPDETETLIHLFGAAGDGATPSSGLIMDNAGNFYGSAEEGGSAGGGTIFKLAPDGTETELYSFRGGSDGESPSGDLVMDQAGNLYGTTVLGGNGMGCSVNGGCGTVFKLSPNGTETVLYAFKGGNDGYEPLTGVIADAAGNLYGTTPKGGDPHCGNHQGCGTVFQIAPDGTETLLYAFFKNHQGRDPFAGLVADKNGNLFGTTVGGGDRFGTVFEVGRQ